jgi:hypothetical protein
MRCSVALCSDREFRLRCDNLYPGYSISRDPHLHPLKQHGGTHNIIPAPRRISFTLRAEDGIGCCALRSADERETNSVAFAFETGGVWAIDTWLLRTHPAELLAVAIEEMFTERLPQYGRFLMGLGLQPPYRWIAGLTDVINRRLQFPPPHGQMRVPSWPCPECLSEHIMTPGTYDGQQSPISALLPFFKEIYHKCGMPRPDYLPQ